MGLTDQQQADCANLVVQAGGATSKKNTAAQGFLAKALLILKAAPPPPPPPPPTGSIPTDWDYELSDPAQLNIGNGNGQWRNASGYSLKQVEAQGKEWVEIRENGQAHTDGCFCPRVKFQEDNEWTFGFGAEAWQHGEYLIPDPSKLNPGFSRIMSLNCYPASRTWYVALETVAVGRMAVNFAPYGDPHTNIIPSLPIPAEPFTVDLHYVFSGSNGTALTELYLDGTFVARSTNRNMFNASDKLNIAQYGRPYADLHSEPGAVVLFRDPRLKIV